MQETLLNIKKKFGKNAVLKGMSLQEGATARDKNNQIGGHKAYVWNMLISLVLLSWQL